MSDQPAKPPGANGIAILTAMSREVTASRRQEHEDRLRAEGAAARTATILQRMRGMARRAASLEARRNWSVVAGAIESWFAAEAAASRAPAVGDVVDVAFEGDDGLACGWTVCRIKYVEDDWFLADAENAAVADDESLVDIMRLIADEGFRWRRRPATPPKESEKP